MLTTLVIKTGPKLFTPSMLDQWRKKFYNFLIFLEICNVVFPCDKNWSQIVHTKHVRLVAEAILKLSHLYTNF